MNDDFNKRAEEILNSWDGAERMPANPFLYARIMAKLENKKKQWTGVPSFFARPAVAFVIVVMVLAANAWFLFDSTDTNAARNSENETAVTEFETEYNLSNTYSYTDINE